MLDTTLAFKLLYTVVIISLDQEGIRNWTLDIQVVRIRIATAPSGGGFALEAAAVLLGHMRSYDENRYATRVNGNTEERDAR